uniref:Uncharacterized protein n=1 Tax=Aegilops tauschii subsp. strangulata TaxID=200361 RepID=A0A453LXH0_AEGTS
MPNQINRHIRVQDHESYSQSKHYPGTSKSSTKWTPPQATPLSFGSCVLNLESQKSKSSLTRNSAKAKGAFHYPHAILGSANCPAVPQKDFDFHRHLTFQRNSCAPKALYIHLTENIPLAAIDH